MEKLKMHSPDITQENIAKLAELFPNCVTEAQDESGNLKRAIDFDQLRQELSNHVVDGPRERFQMNWPGKRAALLTANAPIAKTLRPCREESIDFDSTENLFIEGDNLEALKILQETYLNKVKVIYVDPPYNTGNDFIYADDFSQSTNSYLKNSNQIDETGNRLVVNNESKGRFHSDWLSMMYSRLKLARTLLRDDGVIFISIDSIEIANLRHICDEVFGADNFLEELIWKNKYNAGALTKGFSNVHEYILAYSKSALTNIAAPLSDEQSAEYKKKDDKYSLRGGYLTQPLATVSKDNRPNLVFPIHHEGEEIWPEKQWIWSKERVETAYANNEIVIKKTGDKYSVRVKQYLRDESGKKRLTKPLSIFVGPYNQEGTKEIKEIFGKAVFDFPKPSALLAKLFSCVINDSSEKDGIYLDFFAGSGSTADAILQLNAEDGGNRRFILVQLPEPCDTNSLAFKSGFTTIADISKERIRRAGKKIKDKSPLTTQDLDVGVRVLKIDTSNMKDVYYKPDAIKKVDLFSHVENIKEDRTLEDLLFQVLLDWGVDLGLPIAQENFDEKTVFFVDDNALAACFDTGVTEELVKKIAARKPLRVVFRDAGFSDDSVKINVEQIFKLMSPDTEVKAI